MKLAIFNPGKHWHQIAWAVVKDDHEAKAIGAANGFFSWKLESDTAEWSNFKRDVKQLAMRYTTLKWL